MPTTQTAPQAAPCRPHDWRPPAPADRHLDCRTCGRVLDFYTQLTTNVRSSILGSVKLRRAPAEAALFQASLDSYFAEIDGPLKLASMTGVYVTTKRSRCARRRERMAKQVAQRTARERGWVR